MQAIGQQLQRAPDGALVHYERHRPEKTTLYRLVQQHLDQAVIEKILTHLGLQARAPPRAPARAAGFIGARWA